MMIQEFSKLLPLRATYPMFVNQRFTGTSWAGAGLQHKNTVDVAFKTGTTFI